MKILITGTAGRVASHIYVQLMKNHQVKGVDKTPASTVDVIGDICDEKFMADALIGMDVVVHTAALHAPHVNLAPDEDFQRINVDATERLMLLGIKKGIKHFVFTSTTALYGYASTPEDHTGWVNEQTIPQPKTIYHRSKITAENRLKALSAQYNLPVTVLQMSRCFPEPADLMSIYRLNRGVDARDVASAHAYAIDKRLSGFRRFIISAQTPFNSSLCDSLYQQADAVIATYVPELAQEFIQRDWPLPKSLDRVYDSSQAQLVLGWQPHYGYESVLEMLDKGMAEVLPVIN